MALSKKRAIEFLKCVKKYNSCEKTDCDSCKYEDLCSILYKTGDSLLVSKMVGKYVGEVILLLEDVQGEESGDAVPFTQIMKLYNEICVSFPKALKLTSERKKHIKARFNEGFNLETFREVFTKAEESSFLKGKNSKGWKADFDFFITERGLVKTREGKYDSQCNGNSISDSPSYNIEELDKLIYSDYIKKE